MKFTTYLLSLISTLLFVPSALAQAEFALVAAFSPGALQVSTPQRFCSFTYGGYAIFQGDGKVVVYNSAVGALWYSSAHGGRLIPGAPAQQYPVAGPCEFAFQTDGNFVAYFDGSPLWCTGTQGRGQ